MSRRRRPSAIASTRCKSSASSRTSRASPGPSGRCPGRHRALSPGSLGQHLRAAADRPGAGAGPGARAGAGRAPHVRAGPAGRGQRPVLGVGGPRLRLRERCPGRAGRRSSGRAGLAAHPAEARSSPTQSQNLAEFVVQLAGEFGLQRLLHRQHAPRQEPGARPPGAWTVSRCRRVLRSRMAPPSTTPATSTAAQEVICRATLVVDVAPTRHGRLVHPRVVDSRATETRVTSSAWRALASPRMMSGSRPPPPATADSAAGPPGAAFAEAKARSTRLPEPAVGLVQPGLLGREAPGRRGLRAPGPAPAPGPIRSRAKVLAQAPRG